MRVIQCFFNVLQFLQLLVEGIREVQERFGAAQTLHGCGAQCTCCVFVVAQVPHDFVQRQIRLVQLISVVLFVLSPHSLFHLPAQITVVMFQQCDESGGLPEHRIYSLRREDAGIDAYIHVCRYCRNIRSPSMGTFCAPPLSLRSSFHILASAPAPGAYAEQTSLPFGVEFACEVIMCAEGQHVKFCIF